MSMVILFLEGDIIFGRLYYDLNRRYSYRQEDGSKIEFFALRAGDDAHCIHFPYMASILANLRTDKKKYRTATTLALVSLGIALISVTIAVITHLQS